MKKLGPPFKAESDKIKSVTPGLRIHTDTWKKMQDKYPKQVNKMFNEWVKSLLISWMITLTYSLVNVFMM